MIKVAASQQDIRKTNNEKNSNTHLSKYFSGHFSY